jgi:hypothetical protein
VRRWTLRSTKFNNINRVIEWVVCSAPYWPAAQAEMLSAPWAGGVTGSHVRIAILRALIDDRHH